MLVKEHLLEFEFNNTDTPCGDTIKENVKTVILNLSRRIYPNLTVVFHRNVDIINQFQSKVEQSVPSHGFST